MKRKIEHFKAFVRNKKIAVLGVGISNRPLIRYLSGIGCSITAFDRLPADDPVIIRTRQEFAAEKIELTWSLGADYLSRLSGYDLIFRTPQMRRDLGELVSERNRGAVITSEMEVFMELCPAPVIGITGSDGKTTTTTLIAMMLEKAGHKVHLGGNIGTPLLDRVETIQTSDQVVLELSSFQLMSMRKSPQTAVITNISPNHLDIHKDYQEYIDAKKNIMLYQPFYGRLILNAANYETRSLAAEAMGEVAYFSRSDHQEKEGAFVRDGQLICRDRSGETAIMTAGDIMLPGQHNLENYLAAITAVRPYVTVPDMVAVARSFGGVAHRLELVRELDGVRYFNSSIDTSPTRSKAALRALADRGEHAILIMGGKDKNCDYTGLGEAMLAVSRKIIFCGANAGMIDDVLRREAGYAGARYSELQIVHCQDYSEAVQTARKMAEPGEVVVLTPAGTSYDRFRHFEERGDLFRQLVNQL